MTTPQEAKHASHEPTLRRAIEYGIVVVSEAFVLQSTTSRLMTSDELLQNYQLSLQQSKASSAKSTPTEEFHKLDLAHSSGETHLTQATTTDSMLSDTASEPNTTDEHHLAMMGGLGPQPPPAPGPDMQVRFQWQNLLHTYLTGDEVETEKQRLTTARTNNPNPTGTDGTSPSAHLASGMDPLSEPSMILLQEVKYYAEKSSLKSAIAQSLDPKLLDRQRAETNAFLDRLMDARFNPSDSEASKEQVTQLLDELY